MFILREPRVSSRQINIKSARKYRDGFKVEGFLSVFGHKCPLRKARRCGEVILEKVKQAGYSLSRTSIECLGALDVVPGVFDKATT